MLNDTAKPTYRSKWVSHFHEQQGGFREVASWDPFENWELNTRPDGRAESCLESALDILCGQGDRELVNQFLRQCLLLAQRVWAEDRLRSERCRENYPENVGCLLRAQTVAAALLGEPVKDGAFLDASAAFEKACDQLPKPKWNHIEEATYLEAVRMALLSGSAEASQRLVRRKCRTHLEEYGLLHELAAALGAGLPVRDASLRSRFGAFFDVVRNPDYRPEEFSRVAILRLDIGLLWDKFFVSPDGLIEWQRAIDGISA